MSSGIIDTIKKVALNAFEASNPVKLLFGKVISTDPVKIQVGEFLTLTKEFLVINGTVEQDDDVTLIRCQGGQKYVVLGSRTVYVDNTYTGGGAVASAIGGWQLPYADYVITSKFGEVRSSGSRHKGGYGNYLIVQHDSEYWSLYAHMSSMYVSIGQSVSKTTVLGVEGSTGQSTGSHLHLEIRKGSNSSSNAIDPVEFLGL